jgi:tetratricopeptide (TPR) repeat protein
VTLLVLLAGRRYPYLPVGWLWYLGMLVPVIGLVQVGNQARADRYTYFPLIGIFLLLSWGLTDLARQWRCERALAVLAGAVIAALIAAGWIQVGYWENSAVLWQHTLDVAEESMVAHNHLALGLLQKGDLEGARAHFQKALDLAGDQPQILSNLGLILLRQGKPNQAVAQLRRAIALEPEPTAQMYYNMALALFRQGQAEEAAANCRKALDADNSLTPAHALLGYIYVERADWPQAAASFAQAVALDSQGVDYRRYLGFALSKQGRTQDAQEQFQQSLLLDSSWPQVALRKAWALATNPNPRQRDGKQAVEEAEMVRAALGDADRGVLDVLAAAYAEAGRFGEAVTMARLALGRAAGQEKLAKEIRQRLHLYEEGKAFHAPSP